LNCLIDVVCYWILQIPFEQVNRFAFYERAKNAFAVVHTGYILYDICTLECADKTLG